MDTQGTVVVVLGSRVRDAHTTGGRNDKQEEVMGEWHAELARSMDAAVPGVEASKLRRSLPLSLDPANPLQLYAFRLQQAVQVQRDPNDAANKRGGRKPNFNCSAKKDSCPATAAAHCHRRDNDCAEKRS